MNIHVEELKEKTASLLTNFSKTALVIFVDMDHVRSSWALSGKIKGTTPGTTAKLIKMLGGCKSESTPVTKGKSENSVPSFPINHHGAVPRSLYEVL